MKKHDAYHIAFLTSFDPGDERKLSGSSYYMLRALERQGCVVEKLGPLKVRKWLKGPLARLSQSFKRPYNLGHSYLMAYLYANALQDKLKEQHIDYIFAPRSSTEIALLKTSIPIVYYSDATFSALYNYYEWFSNFMRISEWEGNRIEKAALNRCTCAVFSSEWAATSAINDYHTDASKVSIVPMGPNLKQIPDRELALQPREKDKCKLLFIGVEWERKGGQIAFDTMQALKARGVNASLTIVGCTPPQAVQDNDLYVIPRLNKANPAEYEKFVELLSTHHFFILPTRAECFGVVFCEASAFGLPSITTDTGGIASAVRNGVNGYRLPLSATGEEYAELIADLFTDYDNTYVPLSISSRNIFEKELNWDAFAAKMMALFKQLRHG
jgi:glycosyltransferase involved in cell wall biosynthesis